MQLQKHQRILNWTSQVRVNIVDVKTVSAFFLYQKCLFYFVSDFNFLVAQHFSFYQYSTLR